MKQAVTPRLEMARGEKTEGGKKGRKEGKERVKGKEEGKEKEQKKWK